MISLSPHILERSGRMDELFHGLNSQLRLYLWTINEMNALKALKYSAELQTQINANQIGISHYKKQWRDRYIQPQSRPYNFEDPLKMMNKLVNDNHTYDHVMAFNNILSHIIEDHNLIYVHNILNAFN